MNDLTEAKCQMDLMLDEIRDLKAERDRYGAALALIAGGEVYDRFSGKDADFVVMGRFICPARITWLQNIARQALEGVGDERDGLREALRQILDWHNYMGGPHKIREIAERALAGGKG